MIIFAMNTNGKKNKSQIKISIKDNKILFTDYIKLRSKTEMYLKSVSLFSIDAYFL